MRPDINFDSHHFVKSYVKAETKEKQAEEIVMAFQKNSQINYGKLATKEQLGHVEERLTHKIESVERELSQKIEITVSNSETRIIKWMFAGFITILGVLASLVLKNII